MGKFIDLKGQRFGKWTVLKRVKNDKNGNSKFLCKCDCGTLKEVLSSSLKNKTSTNCGCLRYEQCQDIIGKRYGNLIVIKKIKKSKRNDFLCKCDCGTKKVICKSSLINGFTKSCGCLIKKGKENIFYKHGLTNTRIYNIYFSIKKRCYQSKDISYKNYGGRGIKVCDEWLNKENGFINFYNWAMQNGYRDDLSIDRIDNNGNYEPNNCRWTTKTFQNNNKRNNININFNEETHTLKEWSEILNLNYKTIFKRYKNGYSIEDIFYNGDLRKRRKYKK